MPKHKIILIVLILVAVFVMSFVADAMFVASKESDVFHELWCHYVDRIKEENLVFFNIYQAAADLPWRNWTYS